MSDNPLTTLWQQHRGLMIFLSLLALVIFGFAFWTIANREPIDPGAFVVDAVEFEDGSNKVRIERSGKITIYTPHGIFTRYWDQEKTKKFFETLDNLDLKTITDPQYQASTEGKIGYWITLVMKDGTTIRFFVEEGTPLAEQLSEILDNIQEILDDVYQEIFEDLQAAPTVIPSPTSAPISGSSTPTPSGSSNSVASATPTATPTGGSGGGSGQGQEGSQTYEEAYQQGNMLSTEPQDPFECGQIIYQDGRPRIVSGINCEDAE